MEDLGVLEVVEGIEPGEGLVWGPAGSLCNLGGAGKGAGLPLSAPGRALEGEALGRKGRVDVTVKGAGVSFIGQAFSEPCLVLWLGLQPGVRCTWSCPAHVEVALPWGLRDAPAA